jgi:hypothetical protein
MAGVCRVHDIAELEEPGHKQPRYFLTMEYVDEDLASRACQPVSSTFTSHEDS